MATKSETAAEQPQAGAICVVPDCGEPVYVRGLCRGHWADPKA